nr:hypothetical protein [Ferrovum sp.]
MSYLDADPSKSKKELVNDILVAAVNQSKKPGLPLLPFGALLVKISEEASETITDLKNHITKLNEENAKLQWWVIALAVAALLSTLVQTVIAVTAYIYPPASMQSPHLATLPPYPASAVASAPLSTSGQKVVSTQSAPPPVSAKK